TETKPGNDQQGQGATGTGTPENTKPGENGAGTTVTPTPGENAGQTKPNGQENQEKPGAPETDQNAGTGQQTGTPDQNNAGDTTVKPPTAPDQG
ncbi:signal peptide protein, partial [Staphylococcus pasteuri]